MEILRPSWRFRNSILDNNSPKATFRSIPLRSASALRLFLAFSNSAITGYGKFESLGTIAVAILLLLGGTGVGLHSYALLCETIYPLLSTLKPGSTRHTLLSYIIINSSQSSHGHSHSHSHKPTESATVSSNALWFPILSIIVKEYLYRMTKSVAEEENSSVLMANALHHRSDAFASIVTVFAILGSILMKGMNVPVDPFGGQFSGLYVNLEDS